MTNKDTTKEDLNTLEKLLDLIKINIGKERGLYNEI
jgi:hypothetical protein